MADKKIYLVWQDGEDEQYYNIYHSVDDAVASEHDDWENGEVEVLEATPKCLGLFKLKTTTVKAKRKKK